MNTPATDSAPFATWLNALPERRALVSSLGQALRQRDPAAVGRAWQSSSGETSKQSGDGIF